MTGLNSLPPEPEYPAPAEPPAPFAPAQAFAPRQADWLTSRPVFGLVMLVIGLLLGYLARPFLDLRPAATTPAPVAAIQPSLAAASAAGPRPLPRSKDEVMPYLVSQTRHFRGRPDAPATLIEFADFQCPYCGQYAALTDPQLEAKYVQAGQLRIGYLHFAFLGDESGWAAEASECAGDQNAFWEYHDYLFAHQRGENGGAFVKDNLKQFAAGLGLRQADFNACLDAGKYAQFVAAQTQALQALGVQSTPTFILNGRPLVGAQDFDAFRKLIDPSITQ